MLRVNVKRMEHPLDAAHNSVILLPKAHDNTEQVRAWKEFFV